MLSGIAEEPVNGRVRVDDDHVAGDQQDDREHHGGPVADVAAAQHRLGPDDPAERRAVLERIVSVPQMPPSAVVFARDRLVTG